MSTKTVRLKERTHRRLKVSAASQAVGLNDLAEEIIETWLDQHDDSLFRVNEVRKLERTESAGVTAG